MAQPFFSAPVQGTGFPCSGIKETGYLAVEEFVARVVSARCEEISHGKRTPIEPERRAEGPATRAPVNHQGKELADSQNHSLEETIERVSKFLNEGL
jgi:hypothetical protein